jgi:polyisoprenoid-binding protein YceI
MRFSALFLLPLLAVALRAAPLVADPARSSVTIAVTATVGSFVAHLGDYEATMDFSPESGNVAAAAFRFRFASITTGNAQRDRDMNDWQQSDRFPTAVFTLTSLERPGGGGAVAHGTLLLHGVERPLSFPVSLEAAGGSVAVTGDLVVDTREFGLPVIRKFVILKVDPIVRVHFRLQGRGPGA